MKRRKLEHLVTEIAARRADITSGRGHITSCGLDLRRNRLHGKGLRCAKDDMGPMALIQARETITP